MLIGWITLWIDYICTKIGRIVLWIDYMCTKIGRKTLWIICVPTGRQGE